MKGYLVVIDSDVENRAKLEEISDRMVPVIAKSGGKYLARGGPVSAIAGDIDPGRVMVVEFDSVEKAQALLSKPEVGERVVERHAVATVNAFVVSGL